MPCVCWAKGKLKAIDNNNIAHEPSTLRELDWEEEVVQIYRSYGSQRGVAVVRDKECGMGGDGYGREICSSKIPGKKDLVEKKKKTSKNIEEIPNDKIDVSLHHINCKLHRLCGKAVGGVECVDVGYVSHMLRSKMRKMKKMMGEGGKNIIIQCQGHHEQRVKTLSLGISISVI